MKRIVLALLATLSVPASAEWRYWEEKIQDEVAYWLPVFFANRMYILVEPNFEAAFRSCRALYLQMNDFPGALSVFDRCELLRTAGPSGNWHYATAVKCTFGRIQYPWGPGECRRGLNEPFEITSKIFVAICPEGTGLYSAEGFGNPSSGFYSCKTLLPTPRRPRDDSCEAVGRPIVPSTGTKLKRLESGVRLGSYPIHFSYDTSAKPPSGEGPDALGKFLTNSSAPGATRVMGTLWTSTLNRRVDVLSGGVGGTLTVSVTSIGGIKAIYTGQPQAGSIVEFVAGANSRNRLRVSVDSSGGRTFYHYDVESSFLDVFDGTGKLVASMKPSGSAVQFSYTPLVAYPGATPKDYLTAVSDSFGRSIVLSYGPPIVGPNNLRLSGVAGPDGLQTQIGYDNLGNLNTITHPDGTQIALKYGDYRWKWALTGLVDETGRQSEFYSYDESGRAVSTWMAGEVERYSVGYASPPAYEETYVEQPSGVLRQTGSWIAPAGVAVTGPIQSVSSLGVAVVNGSPRVTSRSQPAGSGCGAASSAVVHDARGDVIQSDDFVGNRTCFAYEAGRRFPVTAVSGLSSAAQCSAVLGSAGPLPTGSRKESTQWHPDWSLKTRVAEAGRITTSVYNGQPDPLNGGAVASCAPSTALLADGKPIVVLCKQVEQATTDVDGSQGFSAVLQAGVLARVKIWTYNEHGQVLTERDPLNNTTTYEYYPDTAFTGTDPNAVGHTRGDLKQMTNAAGQQTKYNMYSKSGLVLEMRDPNNVLTTYTYDARQRLTSTSVGGQTTSREYWPTGLLKKVTQPDGQTYVLYNYDDAHRLISVEDNLGNSITYTLDNLGNRTAEAVKDPGNALRRQLARSIDALGRVQQITGRQ